MTLEHIISHFGYPAFIGGLLVEGETILVLAAFMAHRGYLNLPIVMLIGFAVTYSSDQFFFWLGRKHGNQFILQRPAWKSNVDKAKSMLHRNTTLLFIGYRFMYGFRTVMPFVFGLTRFSPKRFAFLSFIGTCVWVLIFGMAGYLFGHIAQVILADLARYELWIALGIVIVGVGVWLYQRRVGMTIEKI